MDIITELKNYILDGGIISKEQALSLTDVPLEPLAQAADELRRHFCGNGFDLCTIINAKSGRCSENCKFCAQSAHYYTGVEHYPLLSTEEIVAHAKDNDDRGMLRYGLVTSGRTLSDEEVEAACVHIRAIKANTTIAVCMSGGLLSESALRKLKDAGVERIHCNLETSRRYFPQVCTTHTYDDKLETLRAAKRVGLDICSGGIVGMGETMEDRVDMVLVLRELGIRSIPVNLLNPIPGTPFADRTPLTRDELRRIIAIFRFLTPEASIRLAGGRGLLGDKGRSCFRSGANAAISGDLLTTAGISIESDLELLNELDYVPQRCNG